VDRGVTIVKSAADAYQAYVNLIESAGKELMLLVPTPNGKHERMRLTLQSLEEAAKRGVQVRVLTPATNKLQAQGVSIRYLYRESADMPEVLISDRQACIEYEIAHDGGVVSIYSASAAVARPLAAIFDSIWDQAVAYDKFKEADRMKDDYIQKQRELYDKLRDADRLKDEFINIAAHELRTPIMPILGGIELIESKLSDANVAAKNELGIISRNAERLLKLSEDILQASRIETGRLRLYVEQINLNMLISEVITDIENKYVQAKTPSMENADLHSVIMYVVGDQQTTVGRKIISFEPGDGSLTVECDKGKISEVMFNLLDNAMKFVDEHDGTIQVFTHSSGPNVIVTVKDNGSGIDPSIKDKMFEKFTTRSEKGSGLGLFITKKIVEAHGGNIWAGNNSDGKGAMFAFSLPARFLRVEQAPAEQLPQITENQKTILNMRKDAMEKIDVMKTNLLDAREDALKMRNEALERYQKKVEESRDLIKARQEFINQQINFKRMRREVDSRIEKGLEGLQRLIDGLRENIIGDETIEKIELHPTVSDAIRYEASKVIDSEFFQSLRRQLNE
jgi:two-component system, OmpR family, sensor histidine kinase VicK